MKALIVGGTGPTGPVIIRGLIERGFRVSMLHRGSHEIDDIPSDLEHIHADPWNPDAVRDALARRTFRSISQSSGDSTGWAGRRPIV